MTSAIVQQQRPTPAVGPPPEPGGLPLQSGDRGPDVSSYQPNIDWAQVAGAGYRFAFVKATEGTSYVNPLFAGDWQGTQANGLVRGAYHFAQPDQGPALAEAAWFLQTVSPQQGDLLVLDLEIGSGDLKDWAIGFAQACAREVMLYSGGPFMSSHNLDNAEVCGAFGGRLWIAAYGPQPPVPAGWTELTFWQFTDGMAIPGIQGAVDCSVYRP